MQNRINNLSPGKKNILSIVLIAIVASLIYSNSFDASFHFDDEPSIVENYRIHRFDLNQIFSVATRPVLETTFALNYYFGKLDVFGYHLVNLLLHISNGIMLYFILMWTIDRLTMTNEKGKTAADHDLYSKFRVPLYASLIFIAHPVQTEAVTYIVSRSSVLATFFYLLAFLFFILAVKQESLHTNLSAKLFCAGAFISSCLGMGTKQITITLPVMMLIYDYYFISKGNIRLLIGRYKFHLAMFATISVAVYLSYSGLFKFMSFDYAQGVHMPPMEGGKSEVITSFQYFLTQLHVIPKYIKLLFFPVGLNLDYDWPLTRGIDLLTIFYFILLSGIVILGMLLFRKSKLISFGIVWFFVTLSVTSSFLVIYDFIIEHRLYLPSAGFATIAAVLISRISEIRFGRGPEDN
ncbi:MAG: hypothetical protein ABFR82_15425 [Nitrospirota bacterium]